MQITELSLSTMRTWLLLVFLLVSDLSPPGEGGRASDHDRRASGRRLLLMTPLLETRESQSKHQCVWRNVCVCVAVRRRLRTSPFYWTHTLHDGSRCTLSHQEFTGIIQRNHRTARVCLFQCWRCYKKAKASIMLIY